MDGIDTGNNGTLQRDELKTYLLGVRSDLIGAVRRTERALADLGQPVRPAEFGRLCMTRQRDGGAGENDNG